jgi:hypothetical protein
MNEHEGTPNAASDWIPGARLGEHEPVAGAVRDPPGDGMPPGRDRDRGRSSGRRAVATGAVALAVVGGLAVGLLASGGGEATQPAAPTGLPGPGESAPPPEPGTTASEAADVEGAIREYEVFFDSTIKRVRDCQEREAEGIEPYIDCSRREVSGPNREAEAEMASELARLIPVVDERCERALEAVTDAAAKPHPLTVLPTDAAIMRCKATEP